MNTASRTLTQKVVDAFKSWRRQRANVDELRRLGPELGDVARDLSLTSDSLVVLAAKRPDSANLLMERMRLLGLDPKEVSAHDPGVMRDMQRCCSFCVSKQQCTHDLYYTPTTDPNWRNYCPNSDTLEALEAERQRCCH